MKNLLKQLGIATLLFFVLMEVQAATGEVTKSSSTWTTKIDGSTVYTGTDMIDALNAACNGMGSGTINVRNSGDANAPSGLRSVNIQSNQTIDFHGTTMNCNDALNIYPVKGTNKSNVAVKNLNITGVPRYLLHFSGCSGVTLSNITANTTRGTGIRVETSSDLIINGNINLHTPGHCIETYTVTNVDVGTVTVQSDNGCGVLFNDSENCNVDAIYAYYCNYGGSYAGFRQANDNGTTYCGYLYARNCGRGLYTLTSSHNVTVDEVDIADCSTSGISPAGTAYNVRVNSGTVTNTPKAVDIWDGATNICIKVNGGSYGDACGSSGSSNYYSLQNRNSSKCITVEDGSTSDNANIIQSSCIDSYWRQQFELVDAGDSYLYIKNRNSGKCLRAVDGNIVQYTCNDGWWSEMFAREDLGNGYYTIQNRNTGTCLKVEGSSTSDGASIILEECNSSYWSQQFSSTSSARLMSVLEPERSSNEEKNYSIYPTIVDNILNINLSSDLNQGAVLRLYNNEGKLLLIKDIHDELNTISLEGILPGIYFVNISNDKEVINTKIVKR